VTLKAVVLLLAAALVARRLLPRRRMPWMVPVAVVGVVLAVRTATWLLGD
jgi:hypothetical protein